MSYNPNGPLVLKKLRSKKRNNFLNSALNRKARPMSLEALEALKEDGKLSTEKLTKHIGTIFPLILERIAMGDSIATIEKFMGINPLSLTQLIQRHPKLKEVCNQARLIKTDKVIDLT